MTVGGFLYYDIHMGRPRKVGDLPLDSDLRIPVIKDQRAVTVEATRDVPGDVAEWARTPLLAAAMQRLVRGRKKM